MRELIIISYDTATDHAKHYVIEPTGNPKDGISIGSMYIAGKQIDKFKTYAEAKQFVIDNSK